MKYTFFTLNYYIYHQDIINIAFDSEGSILDSDILLIEPQGLCTVWRGKEQHYTNGTDRITKEYGSVDVQRIFERRQDEIVRLLLLGKIIFCFLRPAESVLVEQIDSTSYQPKYKILSNYSWIPRFDQILPLGIQSGEGTRLNFCNIQTHPMKQFWEAFKEGLKYSAYFKSWEKGDIFIESHSKNPIGIELAITKGKIIFLPVFNKIPDSEKLIGVLLSCARRYLGEKELTPPPEWIKFFILPGEEEQKSKLKKIDAQMEEIVKQRKKEEEKLMGISNFKTLLYETGIPLEDIVLDSLNLIGFNVERIKEEDREHDVVMASEEGRALAEIEGKDSDAVHIEKIDQLLRNTEEDFENQEDYAHPVLIGNGYRLEQPDKRPEQQFTEKVYKAAERHGIALLTTTELYKAIEYILLNPDDENFKKKCRERILHTKGEKEVKFDIS